jgi:DNA-binding NarL/FixJ family response regulator
MTIRLLLVDDQALIRIGFRMILEETDDIDIVGEAPDGPRRSGWPPNYART